MFGVLRKVDKERRNGLWQTKKLQMKSNQYTR